MDGRYLHKFLEEVIGKYYDLGNNSTNWSRIMTYMGRVKDTLPTYYDLEGCKNVVKDYFNGLFSLCYVEECVEEEESPVINEEVIKPVEEETLIEDIPAIPVKKEEIPTEIKEEEIINNDESSEEEPNILEGLEVGSKEWWEALSK